MNLLGHAMSKEVAMHPNKIKVIVDWQCPITIKDVKSFLELAGYYKRFMKGFYRLSSPLMTLTNKNTKFV